MVIPLNWSCRAIRHISSMQRIQLYLKIVIEADDDERPEKLAGEVQRLLRRVHGVKEVELTNSTSEAVEESEAED
jgi:hypothetical protein